MSGSKKGLTTGRGRRRGGGSATSQARGARLDSTTTNSLVGDVLGRGKRERRGFEFRRWEPHGRDGTLRRHHGGGGRTRGVRARRIYTRRGAAFDTRTFRTRQQASASASAAATTAVCLIQILILVLVLGMGGVSVRSRVCRVACASVEARRARGRFLETRDVEGPRGGSLCERLKLIISALVANFGKRKST